VPRPVAASKTHHRPRGQVSRPASHGASVASEYPASAAWHLHTRYTIQGRVLVAVRLGQRESHEAWLDLGRDLARRGLRAPWLVVSDGAPV
jgi:hypothetical protein